MRIYHTCKLCSQSRKLPLEITLGTLWFRNYSLITLCNRFRQLVLQFPVLFLWSRIFRSCIFQVLTFGPSFSGPAFSGISSFFVPHFQVLHIQSTQFYLCWGRDARAVTSEPSLTADICRVVLTTGQPSKKSETKVCRKLFSNNTMHLFLTAVRAFFGNFKPYNSLRLLFDKTTTTTNNNKPV